MSVEERLIEMKGELKALKTAYEQVPSTLILYTYPVDIDPDFTILYHVVTFRTEDGSNAIATIEGADFDRMPFEGGAKFRLYRRFNPEIKLISMQQGTVTIGS